jgi:hypothetical protein
VDSLLPRKKKKRKETRQRWEYKPVLDSASCYWDVGVEGKRKRTLANASYRDDDARSDSEDDAEDLFKPGRDDENSSHSDEEVRATTKVILRLRHHSRTPIKALPNEPLVSCQDSEQRTGHK